MSSTTGGTARHFCSCEIRDSLKTCPKTLVLIKQEVCIKGAGLPLCVTGTEYNKTVTNKTSSALQPDQHSPCGAQAAGLIHKAKSPLSLADVAQVKEK